MQELWAEVLKIDADTFGTEDNFFELGGDSLSAMGLTSAARDKNMSLSADTIFKHPTLSDMTTSAQRLEDDSDKEISAFALLKAVHSIGDLRCEASTQCNIGENLIEDIYPCTPCQEFFWDFSTHYPGRGKLPNGYAGQVVYSVPDTINLKKFRSAWELVTASYAILRTRIIRSSAGYLQVVLKTPLLWLESPRLETCIADNKKNKMDFGDALFRCYLIHEDDTPSLRYFALAIHHALFDGWSLPLLIREIEHAYQNASVSTPVVQFNTFIKHLAGIDTESSDRFWQDQLSGTKAKPFCRVPQGCIPFLDEKLTQETSITLLSGSEITAATTIYAAWSFLIAQYTCSDQVVLDLARTGRTSSVPGIDRLIAPTVTHVPLKIDLQYDETTQEFLRAVQNRVANSIQFEERGWKNIRNISGDSRSACDLATLLVVHPSTDEHNRIAPLDLPIISQDTLVELPVPIMITCTPTVDSVNTVATFDKSLFKVGGIQTLLGQFDQVLRELFRADSNHALRDIEIGNVIVANLYCEESSTDLPS